MAQGDPIELFFERDHPYKAKGKHPDTGKKQKGCAVCNGRQRAREHLFPPSLNDGGSGMDRMQFYELKKAWQALMLELLRASPLATGQDALSVDCLLGFPTQQARDGGNYRWLVEKALGDALIEGGYLEDDCFYPMDRYSFGDIQGTWSKGRSWLLLRVSPRQARRRDYVEDLVLPVARSV